MSFQSRDLVVKLSEKDGADCGKHTACNHCTQQTDHDCTCTNTPPPKSPSDTRPKYEASAGTLTLLRQQLRETLAGLQG